VVGAGGGGGGRAWVKHDPYHVSNRESAIKQHAVSTDHNSHPRDAQILEHGVANSHKRLFLKSWHSTFDSITTNERKPFPCAYLPLI